MSDKIDYDELDKAVNAAMTARKTAKAPKASNSAPQSNVVKNTTPVQRPVSRGTMIDFAPRKGATSPRPTSAKMTPRVKPAPRRTPIKGDIMAPAKHPVTKTVTVKPAKPLATPKPAIKPMAKPTPKKPETPATQKAPIAPVAPKPAIEKTKPLPLIRHKDAPNANNYSLGGRSPFMTDAKVEKRPLGSNVPDTNAATLRSTHNVYSQKSPTRTTENTKKHIIAKTPRKKSGWVWTLAVIGVIAAGGGLGFLLYLIVFAH